MPPLDGIFLNEGAGKIFVHFARVETVGKKTLTSMLAGHSPQIQPALYRVDFSLGRHSQGRHGVRGECPLNKFSKAINRP